MKKLLLGGRYVYTGADCISDCVNDLSAERVCIITGNRAMIGSGVITAIVALLNKKNIVSKLVSGIPANPDTITVDNIATVLRAFHPDCIIAVGGGSAIDAAKIALMFYEFPELTWEMAQNGVWPPAARKTQLIAIPSTSGTGTEVTRVSVVTFPELQLKIGLRTDNMMPDCAALDPCITLTMPDNIVAETGMDALTHAIESYTNKNLDDLTAAMALGAIRNLLIWLPVSYREKTLQARAAVHNAQSLAGLAFSNVGLGMAHGISHAFGGKYNLSHGLLNAIVLPYVIAYNQRDGYVAAQIREIERYCAIDNLAETLHTLNKSIGIPAGFSDCGITEKIFSADLDWLVANSLKGSTRVNPAEIDAAKMRQLLLQIFEGRK